MRAEKDDAKGGQLSKMVDRAALRCFHPLDASFETLPHLVCRQVDRPAVARENPLEPEVEQALH